MNRTSNGAFTLVELLVVIAIIGVLVAMTVPAVQAARESANRSACRRNLGQMIIAVHNYEMAHGAYPAGTIERQGPIVSRPQGYHHNWLIQILPYVEQRNAYRLIDKSVGVYHADNRSIRDLAINVFRCPSSADQYGNHSGYAGVHHDVEAPIDADNHGVFFLNSYVRYVDITDGASHTLFIGEKFADGNDLGWMSGTRATLRNTGVGVDSGGPRRNVIGGDQDEDADQNDGGPPPAAPLAVGGFGSYHSAGVNFALGDGSVRLMHKNMSLAVLRQLAHRSDGKLLDDESY